MTDLVRKLLGLAAGGIEVRFRRQSAPTTHLDVGLFAERHLPYVVFGTVPLESITITRDPEAVLVDILNTLEAKLRGGNDAPCSGSQDGVLPGEPRHDRAGGEAPDDGRSGGDVLA
jgi:hypothetical protein